MPTFINHILQQRSQFPSSMFLYRNRVIFDCSEYGMSNAHLSINANEKEQQISFTWRIISEDNSLGELLAILKIIDIDAAELSDKRLNDYIKISKDKNGKTQYINTFTFSIDKVVEVEKFLQVFCFVYYYFSFFAEKDKVLKDFVKIVLASLNDRIKATPRKNKQLLPEDYKLSEQQRRFLQAKQAPLMDLIQDFVTNRSDLRPVLNTFEKQKITAKNGRVSIQNIVVGDFSIGTVIPQIRAAVQQPGKDQVNKLQQVRVAPKPMSGRVALNKIQQMPRQTIKFRVGYQGIIYGISGDVYELLRAHLMDLHSPLCNGITIFKHTENLEVASRIFSFPDTSVKALKAMPKESESLNNDSQSIEFINLSGKVTLCYDPRVGLDVIANTQIPAGTLIKYAGLIGTQSPDKRYCVANANPGFAHMPIDAREQGNLASLINHAPTHAEDKNGLTAKIETANCELTHIVMDGVKIPAIKIMRDIQPGERLSRDYGLTAAAWKQQGQEPYYFSNTAQRHMFNAQHQSVRLNHVYPNHPLHFAAAIGCLPAVKQLVHEGTDPQLVIQGQTAMQWAQQSGHADIAAYLRDFMVEAKLRSQVFTQFYFPYDPRSHEQYQQVTTEEGGIADIDKSSSVPKLRGLLL